MFCCGCRKETLSEGTKETPRTSNLPSRAPSFHGISGISEALAPARGRLRLLVKVERGDGLRGMDFGISATNLTIESTLDAYVRLAINKEDDFGRTEVRWKSDGSPCWDQHFSVSIRHPRSFLCLSVCDDDPVLQQDTVLTYQRDCGFIEIPLWELPRNRPVRGWFTLQPPELSNPDSPPADVPNEQAAAIEAQYESAGRLLVSMTVQATAFEEICSYMRAPPVFVKALPCLDLPGFIEDIIEVKRLFMERLVWKLVRTVRYAISWQRPVLTMAVLLWHWYICYHPRYTWASICIGFLLCFWHEELQAEVEGYCSGEVIPSGGSSEAIQESASPRERRGLRTIFRGSLGSIHESIHGPGLQEFQHILQVHPGLRDTVRRLQVVVAGVRKRLETVDGFFYGASQRTTRRAICAAVLILLLSIVFCRYMKAVSGYAHLVLGSLLIVWQSKMMALLRAVIAVYLKPNAPFESYSFFEPA